MLCSWEHSVGEELVVRNRLAQETGAGPGEALVGLDLMLWDIVSQRRLLSMGAHKQEEAAPS